jgi:hypothetical protein
MGIDGAEAFRNSPFFFIESEGSSPCSQELPKVHILRAVVVGKAVPEIKAPRYEGVLGSGRTAPRIFNLGTMCRLIASFTPGRFTPKGKSPWYPLDRYEGKARKGKAVPVL